MTDRPAPEYSADRPLESKAEDKLNRAAFAERVADLLRQHPLGSALVVGIHGPWGDGKTTVLNLIRSELLRADAQHIVVRDFNPWRLSNEDAMLRAFFSMLAEAIGKSLATRLEQTKAAAAKWTKPFRWLTKPIGWFWKPADSADALLAKIGDLAASGDTVELGVLRTRIERHLGSSAARLVVLVDDIDRLDKHETHTLFRLIKACANFPNVSYVLAFDDVAVASALAERYGGGGDSGRDFLEKIIQVPLKLPVAMKEDLRSLCFAQIDRALAVGDLELTSTEVGEFVSSFDQAISTRLDTPRAAKRYGNALMFALPMLRGEVHTVDLLLIEAIRSFFPEVYECIRTHHTQFAGVDSARRHSGHHRGGDAPTLLAPILATLPAHEQETMRRLLAELFPRLGGAYGQGHYGSDWLTVWAKDKRICSPDYCARYFSYSVSPMDVPDADLEQLVASAADGEDATVRTILHDYFVGRKGPRVVERLRVLADDISPDAAAALCRGLAANALHLPNPPSLFSAAAPPAQAAILISRLIMRLPEASARVALAKDVVELAVPLWFGADCVHWLHISDDPEKADRNVLTKDELTTVREVLIRRIKARSKDGAALFDVTLAQEQQLLYEWCRGEGREPVQQHLAALFARDPKQMGAFLQAMAPRVWRERDVTPRVGDLDNDQLKTIGRLFDLESLAVLIRTHMPGDFEHPHWSEDDSRPVDQRLSEQFMFQYRKWKDDAQPKPPAEPDSGAAEK